MMYINRHNKVSKQFGFSLWELSIVMLIMIGLFVALINVMPYIVKREHVELDNSILVKMDDQLMGFIATFNRLPCPDNNNNGLENCGGSNSTGTIPYKTLGLNEDYAGIGSIPVRYAVFRNSGIGADLANITDLFNPTDSHATVTTLNNINGLDFCTAISNAKASSFQSTFAHIILPDGSTKAVPYVIVTAGLANLDGGTSPFEGRNETNSLDFESANKEHNASYDDSVFTKTFDELASSLNCDTAQKSLNLLADAKATHIENLAQAESIKAGATLAAVIIGLQIVVGIANTAIAVATVVAAGVAVAGASVQMGAAIAACIASFGFGCGAVVAAGIAVGLAAAAVVAAGLSTAANVAALVAQGIALAQVIDVANRAGAVISIPTGSTDPATGVTTNYSDLVDTIRAQAEEFKRDAATKVIVSRNSIVNARNLAISIRDRFNVVKGLTQDLVNYNTTVNDIPLSSFTNNANNQTQLNINQANSAITNITSARTDGNNAVNALGTAVSSGIPLTITYPNADFPLIQTHLMLAQPKTTATGTQFTDLSNSYLNITTQATNAKNRILTLKAANPFPTPVNPLNPTVAEQAAINVWTVRDAILTTAQGKAQTIIDYMNTVINNPLDLRVIFAIWIGTELARVIEAQGNTTDALGTITAALDADANADFLEANAGSGIPNPTTTVLTLSTGVEAILIEADKRGVERQ